MNPSLLFHEESCLLLQLVVNIKDMTVAINTGIGVVLIFILLGMLFKQHLNSKLAKYAKICNRGNKKLVI